MYMNIILYVSTNLYTQLAGNRRNVHKEFLLFRDNAYHLWNLASVYVELELGRK